MNEALAAQGRGANRIELCVDLSVGGLTPPHELIKEVVNTLPIPVNVLIRPADSFVCCEAELQQMLADIDYCKSTGAAGIVIGVLKQDGTIDIDAMQKLIEAGISEEKANKIASGIIDNIMAEKEKTVERYGVQKADKDQSE